MAATGGCLDEHTVVAFLEGTLEPPERSIAEDHLDRCAACTELTTCAAADLAHRSRAPGTEGPPFIGRLLAGAHVDRYQILGAVGRGAMGEVYAAYHPDLDRRIALKVVSESGATVAEHRTRLLREARAIARLSHPNVITVHDAGTIDDGVFIAMEFVDGATVDAWLRAQPRPWREILDVFVAAGRGLAAAHAAGVVHRDFKPQNVMIGRDGSVRVTDFGLALAEEPLEAAAEIGNAADRRPAPPTLTKTSAVIGTPAYMAPEQFRRQPLDARADQFSFCVALHEALTGRRPNLAHMPGAPASAGAGADHNAQGQRRASVPAWLRNVIARGLSQDRDLRFPSMDALLAAVSRGRDRLRRRTSLASVAVAVAVLSLGAWRLATARRVSCVAPNDRLAAVWLAGDQSNPRRQAVHRALTGGRPPTAETAWQQVAKALDEYMAGWSAMYVQTCEATHVRGEQSGEVLDLRMNCLNETLDGARALTEVLARADRQILLSEAVAAARDLTPLSRCADMPTLRSAVPPPHDQRTADSVRSLRRELQDAIALEEVGNNRAALDKAREILPRAEATAYKPLMAAVLELMGKAQFDSAPAEAEIDLERSLYAAEASRDDVTAAKAAAALVACTGSTQGRRPESQRWANLAHAILDRLAVPEPRIRAWLLHNHGFAEAQSRAFESARPLLEQSMALKEGALGKNHPDVARTATTLAWVMTELGHPEQALPLLDRAVETLALDPDSVQLAYARNNRGDTLNMLKRYAAAESDYLDALRILRAQLGPTNYKTAYPLHGIGDARLATGDVAGAVRYLEQALTLKTGSEPDVISIADTQFLLARAMVAGGRDRTRARGLAAAARETYASGDQPGKQRDVVTWLATAR